MAVGDLITAAGQVEVAESFLIGAGPTRILSSVDGAGLPDVDESDEDRGTYDGSVPGWDRYAGRQLVVTAIINAADRAALSADVAALAAACGRLRTGETTLALRLGSAGPRWFRVRPRGLSVPWGPTWEPRGLAQQVVATFLAFDPYAYATALDSDVLTIPSSGTSDSATVVNGGNGRTLPTLTIVGPATDPIITNSADGNAAVRLSGVFGGGDTVVVDLQAQTATLNGTPDDSIFATDTQWWELVPGDNPLTYTRSDSPASTSTLTVARYAGHLTAV